MGVKIIATIGPSSIKRNIFFEVLDSGADIIRINTKYGDKNHYSKIVSNLKEYNKINKKNKKKILFDIKGFGVIPIVREFDFDYIAVSFAQSVFQIKKVRRLFLPKKIKVVAKIESRKGLNNLDSLISASDGIMVARGDLSKNISFERVPIKQKFIIKKCNESGKMVVTATEMLLSMVSSNYPGKAEVSDIVNAVLDGSDALMLSEETAIGKHPVLSVRVMRKIIREAERNKKMLSS
jgi:pyruvate kinase